MSWSDLLIPFSLIVKIFESFGILFASSQIFIGIVEPIRILLPEQSSKAAATLCCAYVNEPTKPSS